MLCGTNRSCALAAVVPSRTGRGCADAVDSVGPATTGTDDDPAGAPVAVSGDCSEIADAAVASGMAVVEHAAASHSRMNSRMSSAAGRRVTVPLNRAIVAGCG